MKHEPFKYTVCSICGKQFIKTVGSIYHVSFAGRTNQCCSYKCYQKAKELKASLNQVEYKRYLFEIQHRGDINEN